MRDDLGRDISDATRLRFTRGVLAEALWEYGEAELAERAMTLTDSELERVARLAGWHRKNDPDPPEGPRLTNARIISRGAIEFFEGRTRDTVRRRRRTRPAAERYPHRP